MKVSIGSDHAGFLLKEDLLKVLNKEGHVVTDRGPFSSDSVDYPDMAHPVALDVSSHSCDLGILICGSGNGVCITANKHNGIRAALCWSQEIASLARLHNDANVLCIPARFVSTSLAIKMVKLFLSTPFEGGRHQNRVSKINI